MSSTESLITNVYAAFNQRKVDAALALMTDDVSWPKASEGGRILGKEEIRAYWARQWKEFDPHVDPLAVSELEDARTQVRVHQLVKALDGTLLSDTEVFHIYTLSNGLIRRMDLGAETDAADSSPASAFAKP